jgi:hypothetical protein
VLFNLAHLFVGEGGGFSVSSGEPAHATVGPIALTWDWKVMLTGRDRNTTIARGSRALAGLALTTERRLIVATPSPEDQKACPHLAIAVESGRREMYPPTVRLVG